MTSAPELLRLADFEQSLWALTDDTHLTYQPEPGQETRRRMRVWTGATPWFVCVVTETGNETGSPIAAAPQAALAAAQEQIGGNVILFDDYEPAGEHYMQPTRYSWLHFDSSSRPYWVAFRPANLRKILPGLDRATIERQPK